mmetsp:Transcript_9926/g.21469  ORF Transcript_9926/g.21469 Transcript_9926/m.21469 type:complete len:337 (+) Transcript_9926:44-1054(+)
MMEILEYDNNDIREIMKLPTDIEPQLSNSAITMERTAGSVKEEPIAATTRLPSECCAQHSPLHSYLGTSSPTIEPLKVCLDDDSSIEDGDEDMFDDDAFTFGDEDFQALMSHESMKRMSASFNIPSSSHYSSQAVVPLHDEHGQLASPASSSDVIAVPSPLHGNNTSSPLSKAVSTDSSSSYSQGGVDSMPSTAASSIASLGTLTLASHTSFTSLTNKKNASLTKKRRVSLHNDVSVIPIPMRTEYPDHIRERIWSSASELYQNAARNTIEFAAEGFDWRNAADDSQMVHSVQGERIHPIHYMNLANLGCGGNLKHETEVGGAATPVSMDMAPLPS